VRTQLRSKLAKAWGFGGIGMMNIAFSPLCECDADPTRYFSQLLIVFLLGLKI
jgi:hypothetical protein